MLSKHGNQGNNRLEIENERRQYAMLSKHRNQGNNRLEIENERRIYMRINKISIILTESSNRSI